MGKDLNGLCKKIKLRQSEANQLPPQQSHAVPTNQDVSGHVHEHIVSSKATDHMQTGSKVQGDHSRFCVLLYN